MGSCFWDLNHHTGWLCKDYRDYEDEILLNLVVELNGTEFWISHYGFLLQHSSNLVFFNRLIYK